MYVEEVLNTEKKLTKENQKDILRMMSMNRLGTGLIDPGFYETRALFDLIESIEKLDKNSTKLSKKVIFLTWVLVFLTIVLVVLTILLTVLAFKK